MYHWLSGSPLLTIRKGSSCSWTRSQTWKMCGSSHPGKLFSGWGKLLKIVFLSVPCLFHTISIFPFQDKRIFIWFFIHRFLLLQCLTFDCFDIQFNIHLISVWNQDNILEMMKIITFREPTSLDKIRDFKPFNCDYKVIYMINCNWLIYICCNQSVEH